MHAAPPIDADARVARRLFLILVFLVASFHLFLIADHRLVRRHRSRLHYELQYVFLSGCSTPGAIPLWMPAVAHGLVSNRALFAQADPLQSALMLAGPATQGADFLTLFYLGSFAEELLFLAGCWLLARRYFRSPLTAFFVGVSALGSAFWLDQIELNFHAVCALPLLLHLLHAFFESGSRTALLLAGNLAVIQMLGAPPGEGFACIAAAAIYGASLALLHRKLPGRPLAIAPLLGGLAAAVPVAVTAFLGAGSLTGRAGEIRSAPADLLVYSGLTDPLKYLDLLLGATPSLDWTLYSGALTVGFAVVAACTSSRTVLVRWAVAIPSGMLALGIAMLLVFSLLPSLRPPHPLPYALPFVRLLLTFLAGVGFQRVLDGDARPALKVAGRLLTGTAVLLGVLGWSALRMPEATRDLIGLMSAGEPQSSRGTPILQPWDYLEFLRFSIPSDLLGASAMFVLLGGGLLLLLGGRSRNAPLALTLILIVHPLDAFSWKFRMGWLETFSASPAQRDLQRIAPAPPATRRSASIAASPRYGQFHRSSGEIPAPLFAPRTSNSWPSDGYWLSEPVHSLEPPEYALQPWSRLEAALGGTAGGDPWTRLPGSAIAGLHADKIQFFAKAHPGSDAVVARHLSRPDARGETLWIEGDGDDRSPLAAEGDRLPLPYSVLASDPNRFQLRVEAPAGGAWLYRADVWDPIWSATVNGTPREIARAQIAYQALRIDAGVNVVDLRCGSPLRTLSFFLLGVNSLFWLLWTLRTVVLLSARGRVDA